MIRPLIIDDSAAHRGLVANCRKTRHSREGGNPETTLITSRMTFSRAPDSFIRSCVNRESGFCPFRRGYGNLHIAMHHLRREAGNGR
jgi:hypothetical protein